MLVVAKGALKVMAALAVLYVGVSATLFAFMRQSNTVAGKALSLVPGPAFMVLPMESMWCEARKGTLAVGAMAPDFDLALRDGSGRVRLSSFWQKPVVLVFGSYTCPPFRKEMPEVNKVYAKYRDRVAFYFVYLEEAHARDVWPLKSNEKDKVVYPTHKDIGERTELANTCATAMKIEFPMLVDDIDNKVDHAYTAWPTRFYVVDREGRIAYKSRPGPFGFEAAPLAEALARVAPETTSAEPAR